MILTFSFTSTIAYPSTQKTPAYSGGINATKNIVASARCRLKLCVGRILRSFSEGGFQGYFGYFTGPHSDVPYIFSPVKNETSLTEVRHSANGLQLVDELIGKGLPLSELRATIAGNDSRLKRLGLIADHDNQVNGEGNKIASPTVGKRTTGAMSELRNGPETFELNPYPAGTLNDWLKTVIALYRKTGRVLRLEGTSVDPSQVMAWSRLGLRLYVAPDLFAKSFRAAVLNEGKTIKPGSTGGLTTFTIVFKNKVDLSGEIIQSVVLFLDPGKAFSSLPDRLRLGNISIDNEHVSSLVTLIQNGSLHVAGAPYRLIETAVKQTLLEQLGLPYDEYGSVLVSEEELEAKQEEEHRLAAQAAQTQSVLLAEKARHEALEARPGEIRTMLLDLFKEGPFVSRGPWEHPVIDFPEQKPDFTVHLKSGRGDDKKFEFKKDENNHHIRSAITNWLQSILDREEASRKKVKRQRVNRALKITMPLLVLVAGAIGLSRLFDSRWYQRDFQAWIYKDPVPYLPKAKGVIPVSFLPHKTFRAVTNKEQKADRDKLAEELNHLVKQDIEATNDPDDREKLRTFLSLLREAVVGNKVILNDRPLPSPLEFVHHHPESGSPPPSLIPLVNYGQLALLPRPLRLALIKERLHAALFVFSPEKTGSPRAQTLKQLRQIHETNLSIVTGDDARIVDQMLQEAARSLMSPRESIDKLKNRDRTSERRIKERLDAYLSDRDPNKVSMFQRLVVYETQPYYEGLRQTLERLIRVAGMPDQWDGYANSFPNEERRRAVSQFLAFYRLFFNADGTVNRYRVRLAALQMTESIALTGDYSYPTPLDLLFHASNATPIDRAAVTKTFDWSTPEYANAFQWLFDLTDSDLAAFDALYPLSSSRSQPSALRPELRVDDDDASLRYVAGEIFVDGIFADFQHHGELFKDEPLLKLEFGSGGPGGATVLLRDSRESFDDLIPYVRIDLDTRQGTEKIMLSIGRAVPEGHLLYRSLPRIREYVKKLASQSHFNVLKVPFVDWSIPGKKKEEVVKETSWALQKAMKQAAGVLPDIFDVEFFLRGHCLISWASIKTSKEFQEAVLPFLPLINKSISSVPSSLEPEFIRAWAEALVRHGILPQSVTAPENRAELRRSVDEERAAIKENTPFKPEKPFDHLLQIESADLIEETQGVRIPQQDGISNMKELIYAAAVLAIRSLVFMRQAKGSYPILARVAYDRINDIIRRFFRTLPFMSALVKNSDSMQGWISLYIGEHLGIGNMEKGALNLDVSVIPLEASQGFQDRDVDGMSSNWLYGEEGSIRSLPWDMYWNQLIVGPQAPEDVKSQLAEITDTQKRLQILAGAHNKTISDLRLAVSFDSRREEQLIADLLGVGVDLGEEGRRVAQDHHGITATADFIRYVKTRITDEKKGYAKIGKVLFLGNGNITPVRMLERGELDAMLGSSLSTQISVSAGWAKAIGGEIFASPIVPEDISVRTKDVWKRFGIEENPGGRTMENDFPVVGYSKVWRADDFIRTQNFKIVISAVKTVPFFKGSSEELSQGLPGVRMGKEGNLEVYAAEIDGDSGTTKVWKLKIGTEISKLRDESIDEFDNSSEAPMGRALKAQRKGIVYGRYGDFDNALRFLSEAIDIASEFGDQGFKKRTEGIIKLFEGVRKLTHAESPSRRNAINLLEDGFELLKDNPADEGSQYGLPQLLKIISEAGGDYEMTSGNGTLKNAAEYFSHALRYDPENIRLLSKLRKVELMPYIDQFWDWMKQSTDGQGSAPSRSEQWKKLKDIYQEGKLHTLDGAVWTNLCFWTVLKDEISSRCVAYMLAFRELGNFLESASLEDLQRIPGIDERMAEMIIRYRRNFRNGPGGAFKDTGRIFLWGINVDPGFFEHLVDQFPDQSTSIFGFQQIDSKLDLMSSRTPDEALDEQIEWLKSMAEKYPEAPSTQRIWMRIGEAYFRKALLLSNYDRPKEADVYFRKSIDTFRNVVTKNRETANTPVQAMTRIIEVMRTAGYIEESWREYERFQTAKGFAEVVSGGTGVSGDTDRIKSYEAWLKFLQDGLFKPLERKLKSSVALPIGTSSKDGARPELRSYESELFIKGQSFFRYEVADDAIQPGRAQAIIFDLWTNRPEKIRKMTDLLASESKYDPRWESYVRAGYFDERWSSKQFSDYEIQFADNKTKDSIDFFVYSKGSSTPFISGKVYDLKKIFNPNAHEIELAFELGYDNDLKVLLSDVLSVITLPGARKASSKWDYIEELRGGRTLRAQIIKNRPLPSPSFSRTRNWESPRPPHKHEKRMGIAYRYSFVISVVRLNRDSRLEEIFRKEGVFDVIRKIPRDSNEAGKRDKVDVSLPTEVQRSELRLTSPTAEELAAKLTSRRIETVLFVDGDDALRKALLEKAMRKWRGRIGLGAAKDGEETLEKLDKLLSRTRTTLVVIELKIAKMSGEDVILRLRKKGFNHPVIIFSDLKPGDDLKVVKNLIQIPKPDTDKLIEVISILLSRSELRTKVEKPEFLEDKEFVRVLLHEEVSLLTEQQKLVLKLYFALEGGAKPMSIAEIARSERIDSEQTRVVVNEALKKAENFFENYREGAHLNPLLDDSIYYLKLNIRIINWFMRADIKTIRQLTEKTEDDLRGIRNIGDGNIRQIKEKLAEIGLSLKTEQPLPGDLTILSRDELLVLPIAALRLKSRYARALKAVGIKTISDLTKWTEVELLKVRNIGRGGLGAIKSVLDGIGLGLKPENPPQIGSATSGGAPKVSVPGQNESKTNRSEPRSELRIARVEPAAFESLTGSSILRKAARRIRDIAIRTNQLQIQNESEFIKAVMKELGLTAVAGDVQGFVLTQDLLEIEDVAAIVDKIARALDQPVAVIAPTGAERIFYKWKNKKVPARKKLIIARDYTDARAKLMKRNARKIQIIASERENFSAETLLRYSDFTPLFVSKGRIGRLFAAFGIEELAHELTDEIRSAMEFAHNA